jgi:hypothetical protein
MHAYACKRKIIPVRVMKSYGRLQIQFHRFSTSVPNELNGHLHAPAALPRGKCPFYLSLTDWMDRIANVEALEKRTISRICREWNHNSSVVHSMAQSLYRLRQPCSLQPAALSAISLSVTLLRKNPGDLKGGRPPADEASLRIPTLIA